MTLYGIYGRHEIATCPLNNVDSTKIVIQAVDTDLSKVLPKYKINNNISECCRMGQKSSRTIGNNSNPNTFFYYNFRLKTYWQTIHF